MISRTLVTIEGQNACSRDSTDRTSASSDQPRQQSLVVSQQSSLPIQWLYTILHTVARRGFRSSKDGVSESSGSSSISSQYADNDTDSEISDTMRPKEKQNRVWHYFSDIARQISWNASPRQFTTYIRYHHIIMMFVATVLLLTCLVLGSCTGSSVSMTHLHLLSLSYIEPERSISAVDSSTIATKGSYTEQVNPQVLVGYFAVCLVQANISSTQSIPSPLLIVVCSSDEASLRSSFLEANEDPLGLLDLAFRVKGSILSPYLSVIAALLDFILLWLFTLFPGWHNETDDDGSEREVKPFPSPVLLAAILALGSITAALLLATAVWQQVAATAAGQTLGQMMSGQVQYHVGVAASVISWFAFVLAVMVVLMILIMWINIKRLVRLISED